jgi:hypothetical protein
MEAGPDSSGKHSIQNKNKQILLQTAGFDTVPLITESGFLSELKLLRN